MSEGRSGRRGALIDSAEGLVTGVARLGYGLLSLPLGLLPRQSRAHMHNAIRELSYGFASLPRDFAEIAGAEVERWASAGEPAPRLAPLTIEIADDSALAERAIAIGAAAEAAPPEPVAAAGMTMTGVAISYIEYDPPGRDLDGEYVLIANTTDAPVDMAGWSLSDGDARHVYTFAAYSLAPGAEVKLWTKAGADDADNLYWGNRGAIWNNDGDTGTLRDAGGATVSVYTYTGKG